MRDNVMFAVQSYIFNGYCVYLMWGEKFNSKQTDKKHVLTTNIVKQTHCRL